MTRMERMASRLLGMPLADFVAHRRRFGDSWAQIADELAEITDGDVDLHRETLRLWFRESEADRQRHFDERVEV